MARFSLNLGHHPETLDDGRQISPGQEIELTPDETTTPTNERLIAEGILLPVTSRAKTVAKQVREDHEENQEN